MLQYHAYKIIKGRWTSFQSLSLSLKHVRNVCNTAHHYLTKFHFDNIGYKRNKRCLPGSKNPQKGFRKVFMFNPNHILVTLMWDDGHSPGQSGLRTLKLTVSQEWTDGINWFFAYWCNFTQIKRWLSFWDEHVQKWVWPV